ncbi:MAG: hypothetical protein JOS17DRAFT_761285, partial [Linnemannia elongata]
MYQDSKAKVSFEDLRQQTKIAIRDLAGLSPVVDQEGGGLMVASPLTSGAVTKRASPAKAGGVTKKQLLAKLAAIKEQRAWKAFNKNQPTSSAKLATPGESPYILDVQPPADRTPTDGRGSNNEVSQPSSETPPSTPTPAPAAAGVLSIGVLAMGDPTLIKILQDSTEIKGESVIAQLKFANNAIGPHQLPNPINPPAPTAGAERPAADRSLGLFFWIILGSVVLIVGIWVGFGVVEARSLARRRQQIALDSVKRRTVDQKVLDTYKVRIFKEDDITYSDDDDNDEDVGDKGGVTSNTQPRQQKGQDQDLEKGGDGPSAALKDTVYDDKDLYRGAEQNSKAQRVYARADLTALRLVATDRGSYAGSTINSQALGRRSGSFDETVYGGLDSARLRRGSTPGSIFWERRPSLNATLALNRDERCRSWAESGADMYDYGGESDSEYGYDQEQGYKSHAQQGWADLRVETIRGLDAVKCKEVKAATIVAPATGMAAETGKMEMLDVVAPVPRRGSFPSLNVSLPATPSRETFANTALPTFPAASARRGSGATLLAQPPILKHKSRFILPRKIETEKLPTVSVVNSGEVTSPTIYGGGNGEGSINSAGPSTAGFLPPAGWGGERRRSSLSTVAVPDNGRGVAQPNWIGPRGQRLRRSSLQVQRMGSPPLASASENEDELGSESESGQSDLDDGRGVGNVTRTKAAFASQGLRRTSQQVHRISFEKLSSIVPPPPPLMEIAPSSKAVSGKDKSRKQEEIIGPISDQKMRFSVIGIDLPDIYSPTAGEFSRLSLDADRFMLPHISTNHSRSRSARQEVSESDREQHVEQLQDSDSSSLGSRRSSRSQRSSASAFSGYTRHGKELTSNTMATSITNYTIDTSTSTSTRHSKGASGKQRKRRYDPCAICLEEYEVGDQLRELPCKHFFHSQCIDPWFKDVHGICPVCKRDYSEAGKVPPNARRQSSRAALGVEQPSGVASFLAPLAMFATGASGVHHWYAAEASMHM